MNDVHDALERVVKDVVAPAATEVDRAGRFPAEGIRALGDAGILGLTISESAGGGGGGLRQAAAVVRTLAGTCGSTAMVVLMHYAAAVVIDRHGPEVVRKAIAGGRHLSTLAFSENGSRSHFWAPRSSATPAGAAGQVGEAGVDTVRLDAHKSWVTSASQADSYVWSSRPLAAEGPMTLWLVPSDATGIKPAGAFDGLGLRGNGSTPVDGDGVVVGVDAMLGADGAGLDLALAEVLPWFLVLSAAFCVGLMDAVVADTGTHLQTTRLEHLDQSLAEQPLPRVDHARMRVIADQAAALLADTLATLEAGSADAMLRVLEVKAAAGEAAVKVTNLAMKVCGGAAFRKEVGVERRFRDAQAARVMAPTTDALLDFVGRAINGLPLL